MRLSPETFTLGVVHLINVPPSILDTEREAKVTEAADSNDASQYTFVLREVNKREGTNKARSAFRYLLSLKKTCASLRICYPVSLLFRLGDRLCVGQPVFHQPNLLTGLIFSSVVFCFYLFYVKISFVTMILRE